MKFYKAIVFCSHRIEGHFRFDNVFQIYPLTAEDAPHSDLMNIYPFILEYCVADEDEIEVPGDLEDVKSVVVDLTKSTNFQNRILRFLSAFSNYLFFFPDADLQWFTSIDTEKYSEEELNSQTSEVGLSAYRYPSLTKDAYITAFSTVDFGEIKARDHRTYFTNLDLLGEETAAFSNYIGVALHNYFLLKKEQRAAVDSAIMLIHQGLKMMDKMKSLSFLAFISSIETMVGFENRNINNQTCKVCGQKQFKVMRKFRDYLEKYASKSPQLRKVTTDVYQTRSSIVHAGLLLLGDGTIDWSSSDKKKQQFLSHIQVMQLSRYSLMNWILMVAGTQTNL